MVENRMFKITDELDNLGALGTENGNVVRFYKGRRMGSSMSAVEVFFIEDAAEEWYEHFEKEIRKLIEVSEEQHAKLPRIMSSGFTAHGNYPFIEMEYIQGNSLDEKLKADRVLKIEELTKIAEQVSRTIAHCHNVGLLHGAICSCNVFFQPATGNYVLTGFGLSMLDEVQRKQQLLNDDTDTMAPEQRNGGLLAESDVYRFGRMMYELVTGAAEGPASYENKLPQSGDEFHQHVVSMRMKALNKEMNAPSEEVPSWVSDMIFRCVQQQPGNRFRNGVQLYDFILLANRKPLAKQTPEPPKKERSTIERVSLIETSTAPSIQKRPKEKKGEEQVVRKRRVGPRLNKKTSRYGLIAAAAIITAIAVFGIYSYHGKKANVSKNVVPVTDTAAVAFSQQEEPVKESLIIETKKPSPALRKNLEITRSAVANKSTVSQKKIVVHPWKPEGTTLDNNTGLGAYRVVGKAYFYNSPDETTRRNAFIVHWNNAILHPIEEQKNFIYIVYTNNEGQTSKGWLRKKDIVRVDQ
ncbi:MAG: protein kinase domain-containing protein [Flavisolibacter sp.]